MRASDETCPTVLVLVTGAGRSGTSTIAGVLSRLGLHVPQPEKPADEKNPRGYYETAWVVNFHQQLLNAVPLQTIDTRPDAAAIGEELSRDPANVEAIRAFLRGQMTGPDVPLHRQLLVKDPRAFWMHGAWQGVCDELGVELVCLSMLRHPLEVAKSRDTAYLGGREDELRRIREIANIAGWCNAAFETERITRAGRRSFVLYRHLVSDWRSALAPVPEQLGVDFDSDPEQRPHPVDDFVDSGLYRSKVSWEDSRVSPELQAVAEASWEAMTRLVADPHDEQAIADLGPLRERYVALHGEAVAIAHDHTRGALADARREVRRNQRREADKQRTRARRAEARVRELESHQAGQAGQTTLVRGREVARVLGRAGRARVRRVVRRVVRRG